MNIGPNRVILWAVSRSRSTALERSVMQHPQVQVLHERLSEPFLLEHDSAKHKIVAHTRQRQGDTGVATSYAQAMLQLSTTALTARQPVLLSKEVAWFCDFAQVDDGWLQQFKHVFLVREPQAVMASLYRVGSQGDTTWFDPDESGFDELRTLYQRVIDACGHDQTLVLESDIDLMHHPEAGLRRLCNFMSLAFDPQMLQWQAGEVPAWQFFKGWHQDAERSTGFAAIEHAKSDFPPVVAERARQVRPIYEFFTLLAAQQRQAAVPQPLCRLTQNARADLNVVVLHEGSTPLSDILWSTAQIEHADTYLLNANTCGALSSANLREQLGAVLAEPLLLACTEMAYATHQGLATLPGLLAQHSCVVGLMTERGLYRLQGEGRHGPAPQPVHQAVTRELLRLRQLSQEQMISFNYYNQTMQANPDWQHSLEQALKSDPERLAISDGSQALTLAQLVVQARELAGVLVERLPAGHWAVLHKHKNVQTAIAMMACALAGRPYLELPTWYTPQHCQKILDQLGPCLVLTDRACARHLPADQARLCMNTGYQRTSAALPEHLPPDPCAVAYGLLTSGTTGLAKIALVAPSAMLDSLRLWQRFLTPGHRVGLNAWLTGYLYYPMLSRCTTVIIPDEVVLNPGRLLDFIAYNGLNQIMITPTLLYGMLADEARLVVACAGLKVLWSSGEALATPLRERVQTLLPDCRLLDLYGSNEAGDVALKDDSGTLQLVHGVQAFVLDPQHRVVPRGAVGQLHIHTPGLFSSYLDRQTGLFQAALDSEGLPCSPPLFGTGDQVRWPTDDSLQLVGRDSAHVKIRGYKVHLDNIEHVLAEHPMVARAAVTTRHEGIARQLLAYIVPNVPQHLPSAEALRDWARMHLPFFAVPAAYFALADLPAGSNQKRHPLTAEQCAGAIALADSTEALNGLPGQIAKAWQTVLGSDIPVWTGEDDFFERGGSLQLVELLAELNRVLGLQLPLAALLDDTRLDGMARTLGRALAGLPAQPTLRDVEEEAGRYHFDAGPPLTAQGLQRYRQKAGKTLLLTGATGFFGAFILGALARLPDVAQVICLVRGQDAHDARQRCLASLERYGQVQPGTYLGWLNKLSVIRADLTQPRLGLSTVEYRALTQRVDFVVHAGAEVNWVKTYASLAPSNVAGSYEIIQLALACAAPLLMLSTQPGTSTAQTGYTETKLVAEAMALRAAQACGLAVIIARCGDIAAPHGRATSAPNHNDYLSLMLSTCLQLRSWPADVPGGIDLTPVDTAAQLIAELVRQVPATLLGRHSNLCNPRGALPWSILCQWIAASLPEGAFEPVPLQRWRERLDLLAATQPTAAKARLILPLILEDLNTEGPVNDIAFAQVSFRRLDASWAAALTRQLLRLQRGEGAALQKHGSSRV